MFNKPSLAPFFEKKKKKKKKKNSGGSSKFQVSMVFRHISKDLKDRALWLISHGMR
jgi:hypothetical protein